MMQVTVSLGLAVSLYHTVEHHNLENFLTL